MIELKNYINKQKAFLIDKTIIKKGYKYSFDIYGRDSSSENISLIFESDCSLTENMYKNLITTRFLYVHDKDKVYYDEFFSSHFKEEKKAIDLSDILKEIDEVALSIFENPQSLKNLELAKKSVKSTVNLIIKDESVLDTALSTFSHSYQTHSHSVHVKVYAICLGKKLGLKKEILEDLGLAALLHDIGKTKIPKPILDKQSKFNYNEYNKIQEHSILGYEIAKNLGIKKHNILQGIKSHHEKLDGSGYPQGLTKNKIHLFARIICICDIFDSLSSKKTYRDSLSAFETLLKMKKEMKNQLDINILNQFILMLNSSSK